jgi:antitoxin (DNA-binding transcriptional repressor) of toxin-antitoxin stability system
MRAVDLKTLRDRLSEYVRIAASGETILVTDRERVVAELVPLREGRNVGGHDAMLAEAVRRGWLTPALGSPGGSVPRDPVTALDGLLAEMAGDRADR